MNYALYVYVCYLPLAAIATFLVARTLFQSGRRLLLDIFRNDESLADNVNKLLLVGFYLVNFGYALFALKVSEPVESVQQLVEILSFKMGLIVLILGCMHFGNLFVLFHLRRQTQEEDYLAAIKMAKSNK